MRTAVAALTLIAALAPGLALADGGDGSRQAAGGGFMSSYASDPYHDPRSVHSQRRGTGQILGQPMLHEGAGAHYAGRRAAPSGTWAIGR